MFHKNLNTLQRAIPQRELRKGEKQKGYVMGIEDDG